MNLRLLLLCGLMDEESFMKKKRRTELGEQIKMFLFPYARELAKCLQSGIFPLSPPFVLCEYKHFNDSGCSHNESEEIYSLSAEH